MTLSRFLTKSKNKLKYYINLYEIFLSDPRGGCATRKFIKLINRKAKQLKMKNSRFVNASGATKRNFSSCRDLVSLCRHALNFDLITDIWKTQSKAFKICGLNEREISVNNIVFKNGASIMGDYLIGGKSGTWGDRYKAHIFYINVKNRHYVISVMSNDTVSYANIYNIAKELCQSITDTEYGPFTENLIQSGGGFCVYDIQRDVTVFKHNADKKMLPASVTKVLTAICALESDIPLDTVVKISNQDILDGSGSEFFAGDTLSLSDALYIMLMESSNTMANAVAKTVGLNKRSGT